LKPLTDRTDAEPGRRRRNPSLFGEILHWMLVPLLLLWVVSMGIEYLLSLSIANASFDRELTAVLDSVEEQYNDARIHGRKRVGIERPWRTAAGGLLLYQIRARDGTVLAGSATLPAPPTDAEAETQTVYFRDEVLDGKRLRIAYRYARAEGRGAAAVIQVGETLERRVTLALSITGGQLSVQFLIVPMALLLVWFGLAKGIAPLNDLTRRIRDRMSADLSPIEPHDAPEEVRAFVDSINGLMSRLEQSLKSQERFVADAAHQMRTPIAGLRTQAELALRQKDPIELQHSLRQIASGADRASRLINQLLALARADTDVPPRMEHLDLVPLARDAARRWVPHALDKRIDLGFEAPERPCEVVANEVLVQELLNNLIDNALHYTPAGGTVTIRVAAEGDGVALDVEDNGIGIAPADRALVFERFYRVLGTDAEGTGLGLSIVKAIADVHGAQISLRDNPAGRGIVAQVRFRYAGSTSRQRVAA